MEGEKDKSGSVELHLLDLSDRLEAPVEPYLTFFSEERRAAILRYRFPSDRNRTVWAELLVRWLIAQRTGCGLRDVVISRDEQGKPYWEGLSFSISPSNEYSRLISFRIDWFDLLAVQGTLKSLLQLYLMCKQSH